MNAPPPADLVGTFMFMFSAGKRWIKEAKPDQIKTQQAQISSLSLAEKIEEEMNQVT